MTIHCQMPDPGQQHAVFYYAAVFDIQNFELRTRQMKKKFNKLKCNSFS